MRRLVVRPKALEDQRRILVRSRRAFGARTHLAYEALIRRALRALCADPMRAGVVADDDLQAGVQLFHIRHMRTRGASPMRPRHIIAFTYDDTTLTVLRVLHEAMDVRARLDDDQS